MHAHNESSCKGEKVGLLSGSGVKRRKSLRFLTSGRKFESFTSQKEPAPRLLQWKSLVARLFAFCKGATCIPIIIVIVIKSSLRRGYFFSAKLSRGGQNFCPLFRLTLACVQSEASGRWWPSVWLSELQPGRCSYLFASTSTSLSWYSSLAGQPANRLTERDWSAFNDNRKLYERVLFACG